MSTHPRHNPTPASLGADASVADLHAVVRSAIDAVPGEVAVLDRSGRVSVVNRAWELVSEASGFDAQSTIGVDYGRVCRAAANAGEPTADAVAVALESVLAGGEAVALNYAMPAPDRRAWFRVSLAPWRGSGPFGAMACHTRLLEIPSDEPSIRGFGEAPETTAEASASAIDHSIISMTDRAGRITYVNDRFCEISGYARRELIGRTHTLVNSGVHPRSFFDAMWATITAGQTWRGTICNRDRGGSLFWLATTIAPVRDVSGAISGFISVRHDHTALEETRRRLEAKNTELEELVYTVSHDLKNPLVTIGGYTAHLERAVQRGETELVDSYGGRIRRAVERMRRTIDEILQMCRFGSVPASPALVPLEDAIDAVLDQFRPEISEKGVSLRFDLAAPRVRADAGQLGHVLQNLIANALRYGCTAESPEIAVTSRVEPPGVAITVSDNGPGIPAEHHERVFRPFTRLQPGSAGTGLGLAIVRRVAEAHGGAVRIESGADEGCRFIIVFPGLEAAGGSPNERPESRAESRAEPRPEPGPVVMVPTGRAARVGAGARRASDMTEEGANR